MGLARFVKALEANEPPPPSELAQEVTSSYKDSVKSSVEIPWKRRRIYDKDDTKEDGVVKLVPRYTSIEEAPTHFQKCTRFLFLFLIPFPFLIVLKTLRRDTDTSPNMMRAASWTKKAGIA